MTCTKNMVCTKSYISALKLLWYKYNVVLFILGLSNLHKKILRNFYCWNFSFCTIAWFLFVRICMLYILMEFSTCVWVSWDTPGKVSEKNINCIKRNEGNECWRSLRGDEKNFPQFFAPWHEFSQKIFWCQQVWNIIKYTLNQ